MSMAQVADPKPETETKPTDEKADFELENVLASADDSVDDKPNDAKNGEATSDPKMDELSSLEQEIAKMHNAQLSEPELEQTPPKEVAVVADSISVSGSLDAKAAVATEEQQQMHSGTPLSHQLDKWTTAQNSPGEKRSESTLEDADLIALLKGTDTSLEQTPKEKSNIELALAEMDNMDVGVTIEGEGQYEVIEIDDDDNAHVSKAIAPAITSANTITTSTTSTSTITTKVSSKAKVSNKISVSSYGGKLKLSPEQARAVALEQMADLSQQKASRRKETQTNAIVVVKSQDIVSSLNDDWNEYDSGSSDTTSHQQVTTKKSFSAATLNKKSNHDNHENKTTPASAATVIGNVKVVVKAVTQKQLTAAKEKARGKATSTPTITESSVGPADAPTGIKRVIKRKIIWDPDAPETQKSFAQYASSTKRSGTPMPQITVAAAAEAAAVGKSTVTSKLPVNSRKEAQGTASIAKKTRAPTPKEPSKSPTKRAATPNAVPDATVIMPTSKRRSQTPSVTGGSTNGTIKKKKVSEIDRLMGDEGAANMIQAVEHEQRELSGGELSNKPLMRKRALTITGRAAAAAAAEAQAQTVLPNKKESAHAGSSTKSTTKKAAISGSGEGSVFSNIVTPAKSRASDSSWDYVYKQRASEESMIVRRRSNSSYSSNASVSRLSLDNKPRVLLSDDAADTNDPSFKFLKPENKANSQRISGVPVDTAHTLANDLKRSSSTSSSSAGKSDLVVFNKLDKVAQLIINTHQSKTGQTYNAQLLHKLSETLSKLAKSNEYNTVLLSVQGQQFCQGIDCQELVAGALEKRKSCASQLATVLKTYLRTLATFPKPLVAGIIGNLKNLGVMQLPLFDYVVSADDCSFETNYSKLGQLPEGYALWHKHEKVSAQTHGRLFLLGERLDTSDLLTPNSFIDKSCKSSSVNGEALAVAKLISTSSAETYRTLKRLNHINTNTANLPRLEEEFKIITEQWSTANCQANFKRYLSDVNF